MRKLVVLSLMLGLLGVSPRGALGDLRAPRGISVDVEIARVLDEIEADGAKQTRLGEELAQVESRRLALQQSLKTRVRALYRISRAGMAPVAAGFSAVRTHVARVKRLSGLVENDAAQLHVLEAQSKTLRAEASLVTAALGRARDRLAALQERGASTLAASPMERVLSEQGKHAYRGQTPSGATFYGIRLVDEEPSRGFSQQRGKLAVPVTGEVRVGEARRSESDGPGLEFLAPAGTPVRAAAAGRVAFADRYGSYGRLVILDHGEGFYTAYGGLGGMEVRVGDELSAQARIGSIGSDFSPPSLFFEVRKGTRTLPAREWLGL